MHAQRRTLALLNVVGGIAVLGSYVHGFQSHPGQGGAVWGGVPEGLRPLYTANMLAAAAGYFAFTSYVFLRLDPERARVGRFGYGLWNLLYALILVPSALWMPLTFAMLEEPGPGLWAAIRGVLALTGIGSLGLLVALLRVAPRPSGWAHALAVVGAAAFASQTALLDAWVWPAYFPQ